MMRSVKVILIVISVFVTAVYFGCATTGEVPGRAFEGAPPLIPHDIEVDMECLECHRQGDNDAVITSHPERVNCIQCHVPMNEGIEPFVESTF